MSNGPAGSEKAPIDAEPAFIETATQEQSVDDAKKADPEVPRPAKNASKPEVQKWARSLGVSDEGTVKEIIARVDKESSDYEQGGPVLVNKDNKDGDKQDAQPDVPVLGVTPTEPPQSEAQLLASLSDTQLATAAANADQDADDDKKSGSTGGVDLSTVPDAKLPLAAQVGDLLIRVEKNPAGIIVLNLSMFGFIGDIPVSIRAEDAGDLDKALKEVRKQAKEALK